MKATTTTDTAATTPASDATTTTDAAPSTPTLEQVPARMVEEDKALADLQKDIQELKAYHEQTVNILKFLCGRLGLDPQKVLDQVQAKQD